MDFFICLRARHPDGHGVAVATSRCGSCQRRRLCSSACRVFSRRYFKRRCVSPEIVGWIQTHRSSSSGSPPDRPSFCQRCAAVLQARPGNLLCAPAGRPQVRPLRCLPHVGGGAAVSMGTRGEDGKGLCWCAPERVTHASSIKRMEGDQVARQLRAAIVRGDNSGPESALSSLLFSFLVFRPVSFYISLSP